MMKIFASFPHGMDASETAQGPYAVARAGFELAILRTKGDESTNEPPRLISAYANGRVYDGRVCRCMALRGSVHEPLYGLRSQSLRTLYKFARRVYAMWPIY